jgi:hypothetical protein
MTTLLTAYLWTNALLYGVFGLLCLVKSGSTARSLGFTSLAPHGLVEYLTVYGGMQLGFAVFFALGATRGGDGALWTLWFALCLYVPIVLVRWGALLSLPGPIPTTAWTLAALEAVLLLAGAALAWALRTA